MVRKRKREERFDGLNDKEMERYNGQLFIRIIPFIL